MTVYLCCRVREEREPCLQHSNSPTWLHMCVRTTPCAPTTQEQCGRPAGVARDYGPWCPTPADGRRPAPRGPGPGAAGGGCGGRGVPHLRGAAAWWPGQVLGVSDRVMAHTCRGVVQHCRCGARLQHGIKQWCSAYPRVHAWHKPPCRACMKDPPRMYHPCYLLDEFVNNTACLVTENCLPAGGGTSHVQPAGRGPKPTVFPCIL